jgi:hypothetical protein
MLGIEVGVSKNVGIFGEGGYPIHPQNVISFGRRR